MFCVTLLNTIFSCIFSLHSDFFSISRLEPTILLKMTLVQVIVKDLAKLWVNLHKHLFYKRYLHGLWKLLLSLSQEVSVSPKLQFIGSVCYQRQTRKPVICDGKLFATIFHSSKIWIWMLNVAGKKETVQICSEKHPLLKCWE